MMPGPTSMLFVCIPSRPTAMYRVIVYVITDQMSGLATRRQAGKR